SEGRSSRSWCTDAKLGDSHGIPSYYLKEKQAAKLGNARVASPLSSNDHRYFTWSYIFIHHIS
ncbi:hypothetical protein L9G15_26950, partial [Shewanella sp. A3A]|nr:hypothetical protein [Shewanella ferrihydritica]MCH1928422.1 hypothetical protein [Shewanella electrica]